MAIELDILSKLPFWKKLRRQILLKVVHDNFFEYDDCFVPTNIVHSAQKKNIADIREDDRETVLFDHF
nr:unnamed protein product [Meloidogyne enterolobii]